MSAIETQVRLRLDEPTPRFWSSAELISIITAGVYDLWRPMADLKQEYFLTVDSTNVTLASSSGTLSGVPTDIHKVYSLETRSNTSNPGLAFEPIEYNHPIFEAARVSSAIWPENDVIYYSVTGTGGPAGSPIIRVAPQVSSAVNLTLAYIPTLGALATSSNVPLPGEVDNALVAWSVAFARAKEREDRSPDPNWLAIYATEKGNLLQSLGLRNLHKDTFAEAMFEGYW